MKKGLILAFVLSANVASADTITVTPTPVIGSLSGGSYQWDYDVVLEGNSQINTGDFFTIFDFAGLIPGSQSVNLGWTPVSNAVGICPTDTGFPVLCNLVDDVAIPNLTWMRTGSVLVNPNPLATLDLGVFSARSLFNTPKNDFFVSQDQDNETHTPNEGAAGNTNVPTAVPVAEPASLILFSTGLFGLVGILREKRKEKKA